MLSKQSSWIQKTPLVAIICCVIYWLYLASTTQPILVHDALGYEHLGSLLYKEGWIEYFKTGPNREPVYPILISLSMRLADILSVSYLSIQIFFQFCILFISQLLLLKILRKFQIHPIIQTVTLFYFGFSPAVINSACSLFSEIASYPLILATIIVGYVSVEKLSQLNSKKDYLLAFVWGILFFLLTLTKAIFEIITPAFFLICIIYAIKNRRLGLKMAIFFLIFIFSFEIPVFLYKSANQKYNGHFALTDRGAWALYGNIARRMEKLNNQRMQSAAAFIPGEQFCQKALGKDRCAFWSWRISDDLGAEKRQELESYHLPAQKADQTLIKLAIGKMLVNPLQAAGLGLVEGAKMLFWESTQIGFVAYPSWLQKLYDRQVFSYGLSFLMALLTILSLFYTLQLTFIEKKNGHIERLGLILALIILFIAVHSFFYILPRYALPLVPLYLIIIAVATNQFLGQRKSR